MNNQQHCEIFSKIADRRSSLYICVSFLVLWNSSIWATEYYVTTPDEIIAAMRVAQPGDTLVMKNGVWKDAYIVFEGSGKEGKPIVLRAETPGNVILSGTSRLRIAGTYLTVDGLYFIDGYSPSGGVIEFRNGSKKISSHCRLTNCAIVDYNASDINTNYKWVSLYGSHNRVDHCYFRGKTHLGTTLVVWLSEEPNYHLIDYNYFAHRPPLGMNGAETIRVGTSKWSMYDSFTTVEYNYFERCNGELEIISNKSCGNVYRYNTFVDCEGTLTLRHGNRCTVESNYFFGNRKKHTGGVRIIGEDHKVINNYFQELYGSDFRAALPIVNGVPNSPLNRYFQVKNALVAFNTFVNCRYPIIIGAGADLEKTLPPVNCTIANNLVITGNYEPIITQLAAPINTKWQGNLMYGASLGITQPEGITIADPKLIQGDDAVWRPDSTSPALGAAKGDYAFILDDIDGHSRHGKKDIGCDQWSHEPSPRRPLTPEDVGPEWWHTFSDSNRWESDIVYYGEDGKLVYVSDEEKNRIPDFSHAGYKGGGIPIPEVPVVKTISPVPGDNTLHIQTAIDEVSSFPKDANGFCGALLLTAGQYEIAGTLYLKHDGVILRGAGDKEDPIVNTILLGTGNNPPKRTILVAGGGKSSRWREQIPGTKTDITSDFVPVGSRTFEVTDAAKFKAGDNIIIYHPCTKAWLEAIDYGGTAYDMPRAERGIDKPWLVNSQPIVFNRYITNIDGNTITIDAPVFNHLDRNLSQAYIYKYKRTGIVTQIGIENLRIDIQAKGKNNEKHAWNAIDLYQVEDAWVKDCTMLHFGLSGIRINTGTRITVENCKALDPVARVEGAKMYNFNAYIATQQVLFKNCHASNGRHHYVSNGSSWTSGIVFLDCTSQGAYTSSEGHRRWSMGLLYDNLVELDGPRPERNGRLLGLYNRGYYGTSHGWSAVHSVAWRCNVSNGDLVVQKPPTAQNYAIGCFGNVTGKGPFHQPAGYIKGVEHPGLYPRSLYEAQLKERMKRRNN